LSYRILTTGLDILGRQDPFPSYKFSVYIENVFVAKFLEVSGLGGELDIEEIKEGGENNFVYKFPKTTKYGNLILKRGLTHSIELYDWFSKISKGETQNIQRSILITLDSPKKIPEKTWYIQNAYPIKWSVNDLNAKQDDLMIESIELVHQGIEEVE